MLSYPLGGDRHYPHRSSGHGGPHGTPGGGDGGSTDYPYGGGSDSSSSSANKGHKMKLPMH